MKKEMSKESACLLMGLYQIEQRGAQPSEEDMKELYEHCKLLQIMRKRMEGFNLPITFTPHALMYISTFVTCPGDIILLLIECLEQFENAEVNIQSLVDLYPNGFHSSEERSKIIQEMKEGERKYNYSYIY